LTKFFKFLKSKLRARTPAKNLQETKSAQSFASTFGPGAGPFLFDFKFLSNVFISPNFLSNLVFRHGNFSSYSIIVLSRTLVKRENVENKKSGIFQRIKKLSTFQWLKIFG